MTGKIRYQDPSGAEWTEEPPCPHCGWDGQDLKMLHYRLHQLADSTEIGLSRLRELIEEVRKGAKP